MTKLIRLAPGQWVDPKTVTAVRWNPVLKILKSAEGPEAYVNVRTNDLTYDIGCESLDAAKTLADRIAAAVNAAREPEADAAPAADPTTDDRVPPEMWILGYADGALASPLANISEDDLNGNSILAFVTLSAAESVARVRDPRGRYGLTPVRVKGGRP